MRLLVSVGVCIFALYVLDALYFDGAYFEAAQQIAAHLLARFG